MVDFVRICPHRGCRAGDKYVVQMIEDPMADEEDPRGGPRCAFLLLTAAQAQPDQTSGWQVGGLPPRPPALAAGR